jgi:hypothetical protein
VWKLIYIAENDLEAWNQLQGNNKVCPTPKILTIYIKSLDFCLKNGYAIIICSKRFKLIY